MSRVYERFEGTSECSLNFWPENPATKEKLFLEFDSSESHFPARNLLRFTVRRDRMVRGREMMWNGNLLSDFSAILAAACTKA